MGPDARTVMAVMAALCFVLHAVPGADVKADGGSISVTYIDIPIDEPGQKAILCWDGTEELMILGVDIRAGQATKAMRIIPFPSEPEVKAANVSVFAKVKSYIDVRYDSKSGEDSLGAGSLGDDKEEDPPEVEVVFYDEIGIHDITVIMARTAGGFADFVNAFLDGIGLDPVDSPEAESLAANYIARGIQYFVLDVMDLGTSVVSPEPLSYRFQTDSLYYPLEITTLTGGESRILLFTLTPYKRLKGPYEKEETELFGTRVRTFVEDQYVKLERPGSPVDFHLITEGDVSVYDLEYPYQYEEYYGYGRRSDGDEDMRDIYEFFKFSARNIDRVKICAFEYEGPVEMQGDISISEYSALVIETDEDFVMNTPLFIAMMVIPPVALFLAMAAVVYRMDRKYDEHSGSPPSEGRPSQNGKPPPGPPPPGPER